MFNKKVTWAYDEDFEVYELNTFPSFVRAIGHRLWQHLYTSILPTSLSTESSYEEVIAHFDNTLEKLRSGEELDYLLENIL